MRRSIAGFATAVTLGAALIAGPTPTALATTGPTPTQVTGVIAVVAPNTAGTAGTYTVGFDTSSAGALAANAGTVTLTAPTGTAFPAVAADYTVDGTQPGTVTAGGGANAVTLTVPQAIGAGESVSVQATGVTNPASSGTLTVATSSDTAPATSNQYPIAASTAAITTVSAISAAVNNATAAASAVQYTVGFTTSPSGALVPLQGTITLTAPAGTAFSGAAGDYTVDNLQAAQVSTASVGGSATPNSVAITVPASTSPPGNSSPVTVVARNATNPAVPGYDRLAVATSSDQDAAASALYTLAPAPTTVSDVTVVPDPPTSAAAATYSVGFDTSPQGALAAGATITLDAPAGTAFSTSAADYSVNATPATAVAQGAGPNDVTLTVAAPVPASSAVTLSAAHVTNPTSSTAVQETLGLSTSADTPLATSAPYTIGPAGATAVTQAQASVQPATAGATSKYTVTFTTSASGGLTGSPLQGDSITLTAPAGTAFSSSAADYTVNGTAPASVTTSTTGSGQDQVVISLALGQTIASSSAVTVVAANTTNPGLPGSYQLVVATSKDTVPVATNAYVITGPPTVTGLSPTSGPEAGGTTVTITGSGFTGASAVRFGTNTAPAYQVLNDTTVTAKSPAAVQPGVVDVTVVVNGVTSATSTADRFSYSAPPSGYVPLSAPTRLFDSRPGQGAPQGGQGPLRPGIVYPVTITGQAGVPASGVTAVAFNVTAIQPAGGGNLRAYPDSNGSGTTVAPNASTVNFVAGNTVANFDIVAVPSDGKVDLESFGSATDAALDVVGYFTSSAGYTSQPPARILDTRPTSKIGTLGGPLAEQTVYAVPVTQAAGAPKGAPAGATSVAINVTAIGPVSPGNLRVYPDTDATKKTPAPDASTINYNPGNDTANFVIVQVPSDGYVDLESFGSPVNVAFDLVGYSSGGITAQSPVRILDTRPGTTHAGTVTGPVSAGTVNAVQVAGQGGVPSTAKAVLINATAVGPTEPGNLRVYPDSDGTGATPAPNASTINYIPGQDTANFVLVALPSDGKVDFVTAGSGTVNVLFDVVGYISS